jgi:hypothetical protein
VDALIERQGFEAAAVAAELQVKAFDDPMAAILSQLEQSHGLVDAVYELESELGQVGSARARELAVERMRTSATFLASLYLSAWEQSAQIDLPGWLRRQ